jgi:hypothetical protein
VASSFRGGVGRYEVLGPSFFPKILLAGLVLVTMLDIGLSLAKRWRHGAHGQSAANGRLYWNDLLLSFVITIAFVASLRYIGFLPAAILFQLAMLSVVFRQRSWKVLIGAPIFLTALFLVIFSLIMGVPLPRGSGIFYTFSRLIY